LDEILKIENWKVHPWNSLNVYTSEHTCGKAVEEPAEKDSDLKLGASGSFAIGTGDKTTSSFFTPKYFSEFSTSIIEVNPPVVEPKGFVPNQTNPELLEIYIVKNTRIYGYTRWQRVPKATFEKITTATCFKSILARFKNTFNILFQFKFDDDQLRVVNDNDDFFARQIFHGQNIFRVTKGPQQKKRPEGPLHQDEIYPMAHIKIIYRVLYQD